MNLLEFQQEASRTLPTLSHLHGLKSNQHLELVDNLHMVMGMETEVGEIMDVFKKNLAYNKPIDWVNVKEEIGDLLWYVVNLATINKLDLEAIMDTNILKLKTRFPFQFTEEAAINRDTTKERVELEK